MSSSVMDLTGGSVVKKLRVSRSHGSVQNFNAKLDRYDKHETSSLIFDITRRTFLEDGHGMAEGG